MANYGSMFKIKKLLQLVTFNHYKIIKNVHNETQIVKKL